MLYKLNGMICLYIADKFLKFANKHNMHLGVNYIDCPCISKMFITWSSSLCFMFYTALQHSLFSEYWTASASLWRQGSWAEPVFVWAWFPSSAENIPASYKHIFIFLFLWQLLLVWLWKAKLITLTYKCLHMGVSPSMQLMMLMWPPCVKINFACVSNFLLYITTSLQAADSNKRQ